MVATRSRDRVHTDLQAPEGAKGQDAVKQRHQQAVIPSAVEQEQQLQADRALIKEYRKQWQSHKGVSHAVFRWVAHVVQAQLFQHARILPLSAKADIGWQ